MMVAGVGERVKEERDGRKGEERVKEERRNGHKNVFVCGSQLPLVVFLCGCVGVDAIYWCLCISTLY